MNRRPGAILSYINLPPAANLAMPTTFMVSGAYCCNMKESETTFDEYRTGYISERYDVPDNCARALQLFELGFTISGAASRLPVTESTVKGYHKTLQEKIHPNVVFATTPSKTRFDVYGDRSAVEYGTLGYEDGVADAQESENYQVTESKEQLDPEFRPREKPLNKGVPLEEIPNELITIKT